MAGSGLFLFHFYCRILGLGQWGSLCFYTGIVGVERMGVQGASSDRDYGIEFDKEMAWIRIVWVLFSCIGTLM